MGSNPTGRFYPFVFSLTRDRFGRRAYISVFKSEKMCENFARSQLNLPFWWLDAVVTPLPIPNRAVKHRSTDDTLMEGKVGSRQNEGFNSHHTAPRYAALSVILSS